MAVFHEFLNWINFWLLREVQCEIQKSLSLIGKSATSNKVTHLNPSLRSAALLLTHSYKMENMIMHSLTALAEDYQEKRR